MSKTIKEIADELGVSKTAIRNKMSDDFREKWVQTLTANGVQTLVITEEGVNILKSMFGGRNHATNLGANFAENQFAPSEDFKAELKAKNEQIEKLQKLLDQSQQLLLGEQKKSQLLIEINTETKPIDWESEKEKLESELTNYREVLAEANTRANNNYIYAENTERSFRFAKVLIITLFVLLLIFIWLYLLK